MWSSLSLLTFVRLNPKLKKLAMLSLYLSLVVFQLGGLRYRLCYSIKFIKTLNEGLGWQLLGQNFRFLTGFAYKLLKI